MKLFAPMVLEGISVIVNLVPLLDSCVCLLGKLQGQALVYEAFFQALRETVTSLFLTKTAGTAKSLLL